MRAAKRNYLVVIISLVVLAAAGAFLLWSRAPRTTTLLFALDLRNAKVVEALRTELGKLETLNPGLRVSLVAPGTGGAAPDLGLLDRYPDPAEGWSLPLTPWSGNLWVLAARSRGLEALAAKDPESVAALREGRLDPAGFVKLLAEAKAFGPAPITLGNSHLWPFMLWLQSWTAATLGPEAATTLPVQGKGPYPALEAPMAELRRWRSLGWFDEAAWPLGWAQGLQPLQRGEALFALLSEPQLSALAPETRVALEFLPFPRRSGDPLWSLGNAQLLAVSSRTKRSTEANLVVRYLTSPGVTERLAGTTGRPFFAWKAEDGRAPLVLPDWTSRVNEQGFRTLAEELAARP